MSQGDAGCSWSSACWACLGFPAAPPPAPAVPWPGQHCLAPVSDPVSHTAGGRLWALGMVVLVPENPSEGEGQLCFICGARHLHPIGFMHSFNETG